MPYLVQTRGPNVGKTYALTSKCTLGRNQDCDVVVRQDSVSRHHARIMRQGESFFIEDLNSRNGTSLNNTVIRGRSELADGDKIRLSNVEFAFRDTALAELSTSDSGDTDTHITATDGDSQDAPVHVTIEIPHQVDMSRFATDAHAKLGALLEITQSLGQYLSLDMLLPRILDCLFKMIPQVGSGSVVLRDDMGNLVPMWTKTATGLLEEHRISRTIVDRALHTGNAILSNDAYHDPRFLHSESVSDLEIRSIMCAPLIDDEGKAFGVLQVDTGDWEHAFQQEELELLTGVASQAAIAITSAKLHENELKRRTLERDLELAAEVQRAILPTERPRLAGYEFGDWYEPAERIGGDYYDYVPTADGRLGVIIADVAGHGIASALSMSKLSAEVRMLVSTLHEPNEILNALNRGMCRQGGEQRFITLLMTIVDPASHEFQIACAGHMPPLLRTAEGQLCEPGRDRFGPPLGAVPDFPYVHDTFTLASGEMLTLYTDGITEATNLAGEVYGESRLRARVVAARCPDEIVREIIADVAEFTSQQSQRDDICLVCVGRT
jgi:serine phosphatase RsbU (regulator of sigma subunit)